MRRGTTPITCSCRKTWAGPFPDGAEPHPFLRYRTLLSPYRLARTAGLPDAAWADLVGALDEALVRVDGRGFRVTPLTASPRWRARREARVSCG